MSLETTLSIIKPDAYKKGHVEEICQRLENAGLSINSILFLCMYLDIYILKNKEPWFLWDAYTYTVNLVDFIMIVVLIVDRDFLGLHKFKKKILPSFQRPKIARDCN